MLTRLNKWLCLAILTGLLPLSLQAKKEILPYKNPKLSVEERVNDLLARMTLAEKIGLSRKSVGIIISL